MITAKTLARITNTLLVKRESRYPPPAFQVSHSLLCVYSFAAVACKHVERPQSDGAVTAAW